MDLTSKIIAVCLFFCPIVILSTLESDVHEIEGKDQIVLNAIESVLIAEDTKHNQYFDDMEYRPELGAQNIGRKFNIQYDLSAKELSNLSQYEYFIIADKKSNKTVAYLHYDECKKHEAIINWKDGVAYEISYKDNTYKIDYNEAGLVRSLTEKTKSNRSNRNKHILTYTDDEKISSVSTSIASAGQSITDFEQITAVTAYNYTENKIEIARTIYVDHNDRSLAGINKIEYVTFVLEDLALTRINYRTDDKNIIESVDETILNESGQIIRRVHTKPGKGMTSIDSFQYNELGQVLKSSSLIASTDSIISHKESLFSYSQQDTDDNYKPTCEQQISMIHSIYDEEGNLANTFRETAL